MVPIHFHVSNLFSRLVRAPLRGWHLPYRLFLRVFLILGRAVVCVVSVLWTWLPLARFLSQIRWSWSRLVFFLFLRDETCRDFLFSVVDLGTGPLRCAVCCSSFLSPKPWFFLSKGEWIHCALCPVADRIYYERVIVRPRPLLLTQQPTRENKHKQPQPWVENRSNW